MISSLLRDAAHDVQRRYYRARRCTEPAGARAGAPAAAHRRGRREADAADRRPLRRRVELVVDARRARRQGRRAPAATATRSGAIPRRSTSPPRRCCSSRRTSRGWLRSATSPPGGRSSARRREVADIVGRYRDAGADELVVPDPMEPLAAWKDDVRPVHGRGRMRQLPMSDDPDHEPSSNQEACRRARVPGRRRRARRLPRPLHRGRGVGDAGERGLGHLRRLLRRAGRDQRRACGSDGRSACKARAPAPCTTSRRSASTCRGTTRPATSTTSSSGWSTAGRPSGPSAQYRDRYRRTADGWKLAHRTILIS